MDFDVEGSHSCISLYFNLSTLAGHAKKEETHHSLTSLRETTKDNEIIIGTNLDIHSSMEVDKDSTRLKKRGRSDNA